jgi:hypothetical protein
MTDNNTKYVSLKEFKELCMIKWRDLATKSIEENKNYSDEEKHTKISALTNTELTLGKDFYICRTSTSSLPTDPAFKIVGVPQQKHDTLESIDKKIIECLENASTENADSLNSLTFEDIKQYVIINGDKKYTVTIPSSHLYDLPFQIYDLGNKYYMSVNPSLNNITGALA